MIHYTCDRCRKVIETEHETRFSMTIEIKAVGNENGFDDECERDHLLVIEEIIEQLDDPNSELEIMGGITRRRTFDLCHGCQEYIMLNPIGAEATSQVGFSDN